jgi:hypothetical protein
MMSWFLTHNPYSTRFWIPNQIPAACASDDKMYGKVVKWWPTDAEDTYKAKGNLYGPDDITYSVNSSGYRSIEFDPKSTAPKIMFVGCSFTTGIGVRQEEIWTSVLTNKMSKHYGVDFEQHNFGLPGYGTDAMAQVTFQALPLVKPDLLVALFPSTERRMHYSNYIHRIALIPSFTKRNVYKKEHEALVTLQNDANDFYHWVMQWNFMNLTAEKHNIPWMWATYYPTREIEPHYHHYVRTDNYAPVLFPPFIQMKDYGRDLSHPGPKSHASFAENMFEYAVEQLGKKWSSTA